MSRRHVLALAAALAALAAAPLSAQRSLELQRFHAQLNVQPNGRLVVTETITARFTGSWNGLVRRIPVEYETERGLNYTLRLEDIEAHDDAGTPLRVESDRSGRYRIFRIYVPGARDATRTVAFRYRVANGLRFFDTYDELYWNVTGDESDVPILQASAEVYLPPGATGVRTAVYTGAYGSTESDARTEVMGNRIAFEANRALRYREGLTVAVAWDPGLVERPTAMDRALSMLLANSILLVPLLAGLGMFGLWRKHGKDPESRPIAPQYEPPEGLTPAECGTIMDNRPDMRDVTATIVDLAVRGYIRVEETREERLFGLFSSRDYAFHQLEPARSPADLKPHERALLDALFSGRSVVRVSDLENSFYKDLPNITGALRGILVSGGYYPRHPNTVRALFIVAAVVLGFGVLFGGGLLMHALGRTPAPALIAALLTGLVVAGFGMAMPRRTTRGARTVEQLLGFQEFLRRVESDRFDRMIRTPELFEKYLPYAMAFGVEANWARAFQDIYREPPHWYVGGDPTGFNTNAFTTRLSSMSAATGSAMRSAPRSSSGSSSFGGGGGGFSGGGFGGGGTGGF